MTIKEITPILHRLQEAFIIYEDQHDGEWDRAWYLFSEVFPNINLTKYTRNEALKVMIQRFAYRNVLINQDMIKSFYKLTNKDIKNAMQELVSEGVLIEWDGGFILKSDEDIINEYDSNTISEPIRSVYIMHRNDFLVKSNEYWLKEKYKQEGRDILQYILIDGEWSGVVAGKFKNGPYIIEDIVLDGSLNQEDKDGLKEDIIEAVYRVNSREHSPIQNFCGAKLKKND